MLINLEPSFSYSSILMTGSLTIWPTRYSYSCSEILQIIGLWPAVIKQST